MKKLAIAIQLLASFAVLADDHDKLTVGRQPDGRIVVPTNQILQPAGKQIEFAGRPVDLMMIDGDRVLVVKSKNELVFIDVNTGTIKQKLTTAFEGKKAVGLSVTGLAKKQGRLYATDGTSKVMVAKKNDANEFAWEKTIPIPEAADKKGSQPAGICVVGDDRLAVTATRNNAVYILDREKGEVVETIKVGVAPFTVIPVGDHLYVSNWGGDHPLGNDAKGNTSGTDVKVDAKSGIANHGSVSVLKRKDGKWAATKSIACGPHSSGLCASKTGRFVYVANAAADTVSVIDTKTETVVETIPCRPEGRLPFGSGSNAVAISPDGKTLYVANGTNNCVAVVALGAKSSETGGGADSKMVGQIPVGWYPGAIIASADGKRIFVANIKGVGSLSQPRKADKGRNSHDHLGTVSLVDLPDAAELAKLTARTNTNNRLAYSITGLEPPRPGVAPQPVPERHGEPSPIQHVVYIIKENRTYDQVLGDMKEGNGDPKLCIFGEDITPNHHALARQFVLLDNFYCSGVLSADGHNWVNEAYVTDYLERSFGVFTRSYPDHGQDALAYPPASGFLWDNVLSKGKTVYNYGEFVDTKYEPKTAKWVDGYQDYQHKTNTIKLSSTPNMPGLKGRTHPAYPWFPLLIPDVYRARIFLDDLKEWEKKGEFPNLVYITLPADHTQGTSPDFPTPRAMVADNDLALGQIVQGLSRSKFWPKMAIFVVEDDPQNGYDHVDGHRTVAFVISPYTKRKSVDSTCYNQTGMVKTIEMILGLNPMNQLDLAATPMRKCFQAEADTTPYFSIKNRQPLDEMNKPLAQLTGKARYWARKSLQLNREAGDTDDEDTLNRIIWYSVRGNEPYPGDGK